MSDDKSLDLTGIGKLAHAVPEQAWQEIVNTACQTFRDFLAPLTALTSGTGRLISAKFDRLIDAEKVLVAETFKKSSERVRSASKQAKRQPQASTMIAIMDSAVAQADVNLRELWANLVANEVIRGDIHPEIPKLLARLTTADAVVLAQIAERNKASFGKQFLRILLTSIPMPAIGVTVLPGDDVTFNHAFLRRLDLIKRDENIWLLTVTGCEFIKAVSDPES